MQLPFIKYLSEDMHDVQLESILLNGPLHVLQSG